MFNVKKINKVLNGYTFIDLFCGIGGFHLALASYGAKCVFASEINKAAAQIYYKNFKMMPQGDIRKIKNKNIPQHDIICAGFPCQPFSISGNQNGFEDESGKLFFEIYRIARYHQPKLIILENVRNLLVHDKGNTINIIEDRLHKIGYTTFKEVLCASDFSVPQARKRVYIIAFRKDLKVTNFQFPKGKGKLKIIEDILENSVDDKYKITKSYNIDLNLYDEKTRSKKLLRIGSVGLGRQGERIYSVKGQGITLSSQGGGVGGKTGMYFVEENVRILTPRECARMMGFPEKFCISKSDLESYRQFGNSVVVNVLQEIIKEAAKYI